MKEKGEKTGIRELVSELEELRREHKRAMGDLWASENRYRSIFDHIGVGIALISPDMRILSLNNQMKKWFPSVREDEMPLCYAAFNNPPRDKVCLYCPTFKTLKDGHVYESVTNTPTERGVVNYRIISSPLKNSEGNIIAAIEMVENITESTRLRNLLEKEREVFFAILQKAPYGAMVIDKNGDFIFLNKEFTKITGYNAKDMPSGRTWFQKAYPDEQYRKAAIQAWKEDTDRRLISRIFTVCCKNGREKEIEFKSTALGDGRYMVMISDTTKQRKAARALEIAHEDLEKRVTERTRELTRINTELERQVIERKKAEEEIGKLNSDMEQNLNELKKINSELEMVNYTISHDLRAPLISLEGFSRRLLEKHGDSLDLKGKTLLNMIRKSVEQTGELVDNLLAFFTVGRKNLRFTNIAIDEIAIETFEQLRGMYPEHAVELRVNDTVPAIADKTLIRHVLLNLLSNAIKYSTAREVISIEIGGTQDEESNIYYVKDNGIGFSMDSADKLFGVFGRIHSPEEFEGTGIGLVIVKRIVERHGGKVWAEARVGEGATFYFSLPQKRLG